MYKLNLPKYNFKLSKKKDKVYIYDVIRKKDIFLTPEEWVRQNYIQFLIKEQNFPISLIAVEKEIKLNNLKKRFDILIFNNKGKHDIIVECKAPKIKISQATFDQIARYNLELKANFLIVTNGLEHYYCKMDFENKKYIFLKDCPKF